MTSQVCSRCRKRRIKCDRELPACKNCRLADVKCMFWDDSLGEEIPSAYLHSLQRKVSSLESEIQHLRYKNHTGLDTIASTGSARPSLWQSYHLEVTDPDALQSPTRTTYLGPGSSARLVQHLLMTINFNVQLSGHPVADELARSVSILDFHPTPSFPVTSDARKIELHTLVPPSTQRAIIEHYFKVVATEFTLLGIEHESSLVAMENPLKLISSKKHDSDADDLLMVFAISTALITRDIDPNLASIASRTREEVRRLSAGDHCKMTEARRICTALCALALCEMISPIDGQLWDLLGRAASLMQDLQEARLSMTPDLDDQLRRLERALLKLESLATTYLGRLSLYLDNRLQIYLANSPVPDDFSDELYLARCSLNIKRKFDTVAAPSEAYLEAHIPHALQASSFNTDMSLSSAILYLNFHPLLTDLDIFSSAEGTSRLSPRMLHLITTSASIIIDHFTQLNTNNSIISIWLSAERVLMAGTVWVTGLIYQKHLSAHNSRSMTGTSTLVSPVIKVTSLLASFAARWKAAKSYVVVWNVIVNLLWQTL